MIKEIVIKRAKKLAQRDADSVCQYFSYQPILPQQVKDLKKQKGFLSGGYHAGCPKQFRRVQIFCAGRNPIFYASGQCFKWSSSSGALYTVNL